MMEFDTGRLDWVAFLANVGTIVLVVSSLGVFLLTYSLRFRNYQIRRPLRRALLRPKKWKVPDLMGTPCGADGELPRGAGRSLMARCSVMVDRHRRRRSFERAVFEIVSRRLNGEDVLPADVLAHLFAQPALRRLGPWGPFVSSLEQVLRAVGTYRLTPVLTRILFPDETRIVREMFHAVAAHVLRFGNSEPVRLSPSHVPAPALRNPVGGPTDGVEGLDRAVTITGEFADFATALSGAVVLLDSVETRSRYVDDVLVWHRRMFRGVGQPASAVAGGYEHHHVMGRSCPGTMRAEDAKVGDFDRRVLTLRSVSLTQAAERGRVSFVLDTSETCYLTSEQGDLNVGPLPPGVQPIGCKHLAPAPGGAGSKRFRVGGADPSRIEVHDPDDGPVVLITSYVSLITRDGQLVLARRSGRVRHGAGALSATAGGIVEPDGDGEGGDVDEFGMPSPLDGVLREAVEEIGVDLRHHPVRPVAVFVANVRNPGGNRRGRGQLVCVVLYLAVVPQSFDELCQQLPLADPSLGRFEVGYLEVVGHLRSTAADRESASDALPFSQEAARFARDHAHELDQHGLLSCLYSAAVIDGPDEARKAFSASFGDAPWWACDAPNGVGDDDAGCDFLPRVVRDPRALLMRDSGVHRPALEDVMPSWAGAWATLPDRLRLAQESMRGATTR